MFGDPEDIFDILKLGGNFVLPGALERHSERLFELYNQKIFDAFMRGFTSETRLLAFFHIHKELDDIQYWKMLGMILNGDNYFSDYKKAFIFLLNNPNRDLSLRKFMMSLDEQKFLKKTKKRVIYRGCYLDNSRGFSWTFNLKIAEKFAFRHAGPVCIVKGLYSKNDAIAYFSREEEIFIEPQKIKNITLYSTYINPYPITNEYKKSQAETVKKYFYDYNYLKLLDRKL